MYMNMDTQSVCYTIPHPHVCHGPVMVLNIEVIGHQPCQSVYTCPLHTGMMLKNNDTLKQLNLGNCKLQSEGLEEVMKGVQVNTKLEILILSENTIDTRRATCLGKNDDVVILKTQVLS